MASENKKKKLKNSFLVKSYLKNKVEKMKRVIFFTSSQRKFNNKK